MAMASFIRFVILTLAIISLQLTPALAANQKVHKSYIVYMGTHPHSLNPTDVDAEVATQTHFSILGSVLGSYELAQDSLHYSYSKYINGFAATLTEEQAELVKMSPGVVSVLENRPVRLHTTRSWEFLGLEHQGITPHDSLWNLSRYGQDTIIGNLDTGVWPESQSFNDQGLGPIPSRWKGVCQRGTDQTFKCNNKLIGARYFYKGIEESEGKKLNITSYTPRDFGGHGTHTLSTAGGSFAPGASVFGYGKGVAKGGSPRARVAAYKVCWPSTKSGCVTSDILAAFEAAIGDGVDVLSVSLGGDPASYNDDGIAIGSFHAVRHGIVVVASAGNSGPEPGSVTNVAPWIFTIGASSFDRKFSNWVYLGESKLHIKGANIGPSLLPRGVYYPLIDGASASLNASSALSSRYCLEDSLDPSKVKGKIVFCLRGGNGRIDKGTVVKSAGGVGMIVANDLINGDDVIGDPHFIPASHISYKDGLAILAYINKTRNPSAYITGVRTELGVKPAPVMASFSSRGPNTVQPGILKPDVTAPGVSVIAAFTEAKGPSETPDDIRRVKYNILSGTSMSCPHVSGVVGLLKSLHPDWNPAAIRSAIMTTATNRDNEHEIVLDSNDHQATPFGYGAGHINPNAAANPGLIYNLTETDYLDFLCSTGSYNSQDLKIFSPVSHSCNNSKPIINLNYPSITVTNLTAAATVTRTVTNVGPPGLYRVNVSAPAGVFVIVVPSTLKFYGVGQEQKFEVSLKAVGPKPMNPRYEFGSLVWSDGTHNVRSPIIVERA